MSRKWLLLSTILDYLPDSYVAELAAKGVEVRDCASTEERFPELLSQAAIVIGGIRLRWDRELLATAPKLKLLIKPGKGLDNYCIPDIENRGVKLVNTPESNTQAVAELALAMILSALRGIANARTKLLASPDKVDWFLPTGRELRGRRVGLIGFGRIPQTLAGLLSSFNVDITAFDQVYNEDALKKLNVRPASMEEIFSQAEIISIHLPGGEGTRGIVSRDLLARCRGTVLVNTGRGTVCHDADILEALEQGWLDYACLDVLENEPPEPSHPLLRHPRAFVTPHCGGSTQESDKNEMRIIRQVVDEFVNSVTSEQVS